MKEQAYLGLLVGATRRSIKHAVGVRVEPYRLTPQQFWILVAVSENEGLSLRALAERQGSDEPTASRLIAALVRRKLIRVDAAEGDRRRSVIRLATAGLALVPKLRRVAAAVRAAVVAGLSESELETTRRALRRVISNMEHFSAAKQSSARSSRTADSD